MKSEELEVEILKRQNREMAIKLQYYRTQNHGLKSKNQELNQWVGNLSEVFSMVAASWESITILEETLLALMKKKQDVKDKTLLRKYQNYFKTFADIINNLSDKIQNVGHSNQVTTQSKQQLRSFVSNYELLFKQFIETYFKYNQQYQKFLNQLSNREDIQNNMRTIVLKNIQNTQKIKDFQNFIKPLKDNFLIFQQYNNQKLLQGIVQKKQQQITKLKQRLQTIQRRIKIMFDYNTASIGMQIQCKQGDCECICGGTQLKYMRSIWQQKLKSDSKAITKNIQQYKNGTPNQSIQKLQLQLSATEQQRQNLIKRNSILVDKISKMNVQYKLTQQMILKSSVYISLKQQCQYLMDYTTQLMNKLKKQQQLLNLIEKARNDEIRDIKKKNEKYKNAEDKQNYFNNNNNNFFNSLDIFKNQTFGLINNLINSYQQLNKKGIKQQQYINNFKNTFQQLRKSNQQLNKKVTQLQNKQINKTQLLQLKYQRYKQMENIIQILLENHSNQTIQVWKEFIGHVKGRDKKIKDLQSALRKKDRQIAQKAKVEQLMNQTLTQTQKNYLQNKQKLDKTVQFIKKFQSELIKLAQQNNQIRNQQQQIKSVLNLRLKTQSQARNKLQQKVSIISKIQTQFIQIKQNQNRIRKDYQIWLQQHKKQLESCQKDRLEKQLLLKNIIEQSNQKQKQLQKLQTQKQNLKSQVRELKKRVENLMTTTQNQLLRMQLNEYKGKIMCNCTGDRQREVVLKTCPHLFCKKCIDDTTINRNRKCPLCGIRFTKTDVHEIKWN